MSVTITKPTLESTVCELVRTHFVHEWVGVTSNKALEQKKIFQRGVREGIAALLFLHRGDSLPRFRTIPPLYESDVHSILRDYESDFTHASGPEKVILLDTIYGKLIELAVPQDLRDTDEGKRRKAVLDREEPAVAADIEWLTPLLEAKKRELEELSGLLAPVGFEKVNHVLGKMPRPEPVCGGGCGAGLSTFDSKVNYHRHLIIGHTMSEREAGQRSVEGWSRRTTWMQANERYSGLTDVARPEESKIRTTLPGTM